MTHNVTFRDWKQFDDRDTSFDQQGYSLMHSEGMTQLGYVLLPSGQVHMTRQLKVNQGQLFVKALDLSDELPKLKWRQTESAFKLELKKHSGLVHQIFESFKQPLNFTNVPLAHEYRHALYELFGKPNYQNLAGQFLHVDYLESQHRFNKDPQLLACGAGALFDARRKMNFEEASHKYCVNKPQPVDNQQEHIVHPGFFSSKAAAYSAPDQDVFETQEPPTAMDKNPLVTPVWKCKEIKKDRRFTIEHRRLHEGPNKKRKFPGGYVLWSSVPDRMTLTYLVDLLFDSAIRLDMHVKAESFDDFANASENIFFTRFWNEPHITDLLSQDNIESVYQALAELPYDSVDSVQALYECLHFLCEHSVPELSWKLEYLLTGALLANIYGRRMHNHAVKLLLANFCVLVKHRTPFVSSTLLPELEQLSFKRKEHRFPNVLNHKLPDHQFITKDRASLSQDELWLKFLNDPRDLPIVLQEGMNDPKGIAAYLRYAFQQRLVNLNLGVKQFGRMVRPALVQHHDKNTLDWTYVVAELGYGTLVPCRSQYLGQTLLRTKPHFYLLTRYLVQCRNTGALHSFRFKHLAQSQQQYLQNHGESVTNARKDTQGYLSWYLQHVWERLGKPRPAYADVLMDIKALVDFTELELVGQDCLLFCTEVEQATMAKQQWDNLEDEMNSFRDFNSNTMHDDDSDTIRLVEKLGANFVPCFIDLLLRRQLLRVWMLQQFGDPSDQRPQKTEFLKSCDQKLDNFSVLPSGLQEDQLVLLDKEIIGSPDGEKTEGNVKRSEVWDQALTWKFNEMAEEMKKTSHAAYPSRKQAKSRKQSAVKESVFGTLAEKQPPVKRSSSATSVKKRQSRTERPDVKPDSHEEAVETGYEQVFAEDEDMHSDKASEKEQIWLGEEMQPVDLAARAGQMQSQLQHMLPSESLLQAPDVVQNIAEQAFRLSGLPQEFHKRAHKIAEVACQYFVSIFIDPTQYEVHEQTYEFTENLALPLSILQGSNFVMRGWQLQFWLQQCACFAEESQMRDLMTYCCQGIFLTYLKMNNADVTTFYAQVQVEQQQRFQQSLAAQAVRYSAKTPLKRESDDDQF